MNRNKTVKIIVLFLILIFVLNGCVGKAGSDESSGSIIVSEETNDASVSAVLPEETTEMVDPGDDNSKEYHLEDNDDLEEYQSLVYQSIIDQLDTDNVFIEDIQVAYYSQEYIEDVIYNSKESKFFGYTLSELDDQFNGVKYAFTVDETGATQVHEFENYDFTTETIIKNVAIGTAVIAVCVIVTIATYGAASEATVPCAVVVVNDIAYAMSEGAIISAAAGAAIGGVTAGIITGLETQDMNAAFKAVALEASNAYKWGAITGAVSGGMSEAISLSWASGGGVSFTEAAFIQKQSKLPSSFIRKLSSYDEYLELVQNEQAGGLAVTEIAAICNKTKYPIELVKQFNKTEEGIIYYEQVGLVAKEVNGKLALVRDIDLDYVSEVAGNTMTNLERMQSGYAAIDPQTGLPYELHHIGQTVDSPLAILTKAEHTGNGNNRILHDINIGDGTGVHSLLSDSEWANQRKAFWEAFAKLFSN